MEENKLGHRKKPNFLLLLFLFIGVLFITWIINELVFYQIPLINISTDYIINIISTLKLHRHKHSFMIFICGFSVFLVIFAYYIASIHTTLLGKEYGSARFEDAQIITKRYSSKDLYKNKIFGENVQVSIDDNETGFNANTCVVGGSGAGKSFRYVIPNLLKANTSFVCLDPKGELMRKNANYLKSKGYQIKCINFVRFTQSDRYNPIKYIKTDEDVSILVKNIMENTTPKGSIPPDPFWPAATEMYFKFLFYLTWLEGKDKNIPELLDYMMMSEVNEDGTPSDMDMLIDELELEHGSHYQPVYYYRKVFKGADDTIRSIILSANSRIDFLDTPELRRILSDDDINIKELQTGINYDGKTKTALFLIIPSNDKTFNALIGMFYTQLFQVLYYEGDFVFDGRAPIPLQCYMDEAANVPLPDNFPNILATCRSYGISINVIFQNLAQLQKIFEKEWESLTGNCDFFLYLGGNEKGSHKYVSEMLDKWTIDKQNSSKSYGQYGSASRSTDVLGRELMTPGEVRLLSRKKCILIMASNYPVVDYKCRTQKYMEFKEAKKLGKYVHHPVILRDKDGKYITSPSPAKEYELITKNSFSKYKELAETNPDIHIYKFNASDLSLEDIEDESISAERLNELLSVYQENVEREIAFEEEQKKKKSRKISHLNSLMDIVTNQNYTDEQLIEVQYALSQGLSEEEIKEHLLKQNLSSVRMHFMIDLLVEQKQLNN